MPKVRSQKKPCQSVMSAGGLNSATKHAASGKAAATSIGWRRPQRLRMRSDQTPISGSVTASTSTETAIAAPTIHASMPTTCW